MAIRNFWIEGHVDGRKTEITGGPRSKEDGFSLTIYMRHNGSITEPVTISGRAHEGKLFLEVKDIEGATVLLHETKR